MPENTVPGTKVLFKLIAKELFRAIKNGKLTVPVVAVAAIPVPNWMSVPPARVHLGEEAILGFKTSEREPAKIICGPGALGVILFAGGVFVDVSSGGIFKEPDASTFTSLVPCPVLISEIVIVIAA